MKVAENEEYIINHKDDPEYYEVIYLKYEKLIHDVAHDYYVVGFEHEDLFSIGVLKLMTIIDKWNPDAGCKFSTYLIHALHNEYKMLLRKQTNSKRGFGIVPMSLDAEVEGAEDMLLQEFISDENALKQFDQDNPLEILNEYCRTLKKERDATILTMYLLDEMNQRDIAESLDISQSYVSRIIRRHTQILKDMYS